MATCLICNRTIPQTITLTELFSFQPLQSPSLCSRCRRKCVELKDRPHCPCCFRLQETEAVCADCRRWQKLYPHLPGNHQAFFSYSEQLKEWLHRFKFSGDVRMAACFRTELRHFQKEHPRQLFVPVPISAASRRERGFNQSEELLKSAGIPYCDLLENRQEGRRQAEKNRQERLRTGQPFVLRKEALPSPDTPILLVDDVYTTGRTIYHARDLLYRQGLKEVRSLSIAR